MDRGTVVYAGEPRRDRRGGAEARDGDLTLGQPAALDTIAQRRRSRDHDLRRQPRASARSRSRSSSVGGETRRDRVHEAGSLRVRCPSARRRARSRASSTRRAAWPAATVRVDIAVGEGTRLVVTTAAAEKVYRSLGRDSTHRRKSSTSPLARRSPGCRRRRSCSTARGCRARIDVDLAPDATLVLPRPSCSAAPAWARRCEHGALLDRWRVRRGGKLVFAETVRLDGAIAARLAEPAVREGGVAHRDRAHRAGRRGRVAAVRALASSEARSALGLEWHRGGALCARRRPQRCGATSSVF